MTQPPPGEPQRRDGGEDQGPNPCSLHVPPVAAANDGRLFNSERLSPRHNIKPPMWLMAKGHHLGLLLDRRCVTSWWSCF